MSYLYVNENGASIGVKENYITVTYSDGLLRKIPIETLESVQIFGQAHMTTPCTIQCLKRGITVVYYSKGGAYFGRLESTGHINVERQRLQCKLYQTDFAFGLARRIINAKIHNQLVVMKRYERTSDEQLAEETKMIRIFEKKAMESTTIEQLMGNEGSAAKYYFKGLSKVINEEFKFEGRNRRPPKDPFNSLLSLGYSILLNEIYGKLVTRGLNPYFGFMHADRERHPTLASDLMEEWRAVIVDALVMSMINGHEIQRSHFENGLDMPGIDLTGEGMKIFIKKYDKKTRTEVKYFEEASAVSFRQAMDIQIGHLVKAIEQEDYELYTPLRIR